MGKIGWRISHARPYPYDEPRWEIDASKPLFTELNVLGAAVKTGAISNGVSVNQTDIRSRVYRDPITGKYYLVALKKTSGGKTATFTLTPTIPFQRAIPLFENSSTKTINRHAFSDTFTSYGIHVYELVP